MANEEQLAILRQGVEVWNKWKKENIDVEIDLSGTDLADAYLVKTNLARVNLRDANLAGANLTNANLYQAGLKEACLVKANLHKASLEHAFLARGYLSGADLSEARLTGANLMGADLTKADLRNSELPGVNLELADLSDANLQGADLRYVSFRNANLLRADLSSTNLSESNFSQADISGANLSKSNLEYSSLIRTKISNAIISKSNVYGISVWDLEGEFNEQKDLIVTPDSQSAVTVDNIEVAQFIYLILNNKKLRNVIDTVTTKAVLILGRFYNERKQVLDALKEALRERGFAPIIFDFVPSRQRDLTETIQLLANMAKFVIADITDAKSIPQELSHIIPFLPSVPIQPILLISKEKEYAMFEHWRSFNTVLPEFLYLDKQDLLDNLEAKIIQPIDTWRKGQNEVSILQNRIKELEAKISGSK